jgi:hypothetical protein
MTEAKEELPKATTAAGWKKAAKHYPLLPSGVRVGIKLPDLPAMIETGELPQDLIDAAIGYANGRAPEEPDTASVGKDRRFRDELVKATVVEPKLTDEDVKDIPIEDKDLLVAFALRREDMDAEGEHLAGLTKSEKFRTFRGIDGLDSLFAGS